MSGTLRSLLAEFAGTFALVWFSAAAVCAASGPAAPLAAALAYGAALAALSYAFSASSEAHFNPAITAALCLTRRMELGKGIFLVVCQLLGAALAGLFIVRSFPEGSGYGVCALNGAGFRMGTLIEAMATFWVAFVYFSDRQHRALALGASTIAASLAISILTGGALNPARAFGPALATGQWAHWYVYWVGPLVGATAAVLLRDFIFQEAS